MPCTPPVSARELGLEELRRRDRERESREREIEAFEAQRRQTEQEPGAEAHQPRGRQRPVVRDLQSIMIAAV